MLCLKKIARFHLIWETTKGKLTMSPWEGAVIYQRNPLTSHMEYCTTLERLGSAELSTDTLKTRASVIGLRVTEGVKDFPQGTPVLISADVTRKKQKLRLDEIVRTIIILMCNKYTSYIHCPDFRRYLEKGKKKK